VTLVARVTHLLWKHGGEADVVTIGAHAMTLRSTIPSPPGSRIEASLASDPSRTVKFKIHGSKRQPDGTFVLEGRPLDLTKDLREKLAALIA
jgi:hypothetical protein